MAPSHQRAVVDRGAVLDQLAEQVRPVTLASHQVLSVVPPLAGLLPDGGLRRGSTVAVEGRAGTSLALALCAEASAAGSWTAAVGVPSLGLVAADDAGLALERLVLVAPPPPDTWATVVATLVDAFDLVLVRPPRVRQRDIRRLGARLRERGAVLVVVGDATGWPVAPDVRLTTVTGVWQGIGNGHGRLAARQVEVVADGRGAAARTRRTVLWLPGADGRPAPVAPEALDDGRTGDGPAGAAHAGAAHAGADADCLVPPAGPLREVG